MNTHERDPEKPGPHGFDAARHPFARHFEKFDRTKGEEFGEIWVCRKDDEPQWNVVESTKGMQRVDQAS